MCAAVAAPSKISPPATSAEPAVGPQEPKLPSWLRNASRFLHYIHRTEEAYCRRFKTAMIYAHVLNRRGRGVRVSADTL